MVMTAQPVGHLQPSITGNPISSSKPCHLTGKTLAKANDSNAGAPATWKKAIYIFLIVISAGLAIGFFGPHLLIAAVAVLPTVLFVRSFMKLQGWDGVLSERDAKQNRTYQAIMTAADILFIRRQDLPTEDNLKKFIPQSLIYWGRFENDGRLFVIFQYRIRTNKFEKEESSADVKEDPKPKESSAIVIHKEDLSGDVKEDSEPTESYGVAHCMMQRATVDSPWIFSATTPEELKTYFREKYKKENRFKNVDAQGNEIEISDSAVIETVLSQIVSPILGVSYRHTDFTQCHDLELLRPPQRY